MNITNSSNGDDDSATAVYIGLRLTCALTFIIGFPTNIIIINLVARRRSLKNPTNYFVSSLAVADVLVLAWMMLWTIGLDLFPYSVNAHKYIYPSLDIFLGIASMLNVACVSMDRATAVSYPLNYENLMTRKKSAFIIGGCWIFAIFVLLAAFLRAQFESVTYNKVILYASFTSYFVPVLIIIICYALILLVIIQQLKGIAKVVSTARQLLRDKDRADKRRRRRRKLLREIKVTGNVLMLIVPFTVGWTYFIGSHIYEEVNNQRINDLGHNFAIIIIPWLLSGINPILYLLLTRSLRRAFIDVIHKLYKRNRYPFDESRSNIFSSISRRASNVFRRPSMFDDENGSSRRCETKSTQSDKSSEGAKDVEINISTASFEEREIVQYATVV